MNSYNFDNSDKDFEFFLQFINSFNDSNYENYKRNQQFLIVNHTVNQRKGSEVFKIWQHGEKQRRVDDGSMDRY
jgi:hypothetical protein